MYLCRECVAATCTCHPLGVLRTSGILGWRRGDAFRHEFVELVFVVIFAFRVCLVCIPSHSVSCLRVLLSMAMSAAECTLKCAASQEADRCADVADDAELDSDLR